MRYAARPIAKKKQQTENDAELFHARHLIHSLEYSPKYFSIFLHS